MKESGMKHVIVRKDFIEQVVREKSVEQLQETAYSIHNVLTREEFLKSDRSMDHKIPKLERFAEVRLLGPTERVKNYDEYVKKQ